jgi:tRNA(fMet)-specific endonuclease VapC
VTRFVLDTDHLSLLQRAHPLVVRRVASVPREDLAITIVTAEEQLRGWLAAIGRQHMSERQVQAYEGLRNTLVTLQSIPILEFDVLAYRQYELLRRQGIRVGSQDLRIAAITLMIGATMITRNRRDFSQVPELAIEDWSLTPT